MTDTERYRCWRMVNEVLSSDAVHRVLMYGPPGTGKTMAATKAAGNREVYSVTLTEDMSVAELIGHYVPKGHEFVWHDGPALRAWRYGGLLVLNEIDQAAGAVMTALHAILDDKQIARLTLSTGETVRPHTNFLAIATMNGEPHYLADALLDRFDARIHVNVPHPDAVEALPVAMRPVVLNSYSDPRKLISLRRFVAYVTLRRAGLDDTDAARVSFGDGWEAVVEAIKIGVREE